jgi:hypothetical protein
MGGWKPTLSPVKDSAEKIFFGGNVFPGLILMKECVY